MLKYFYFLSIFTIFGLSVYAKYPDELPKCKNGDLKCIQLAIEKIVKTIPNGHRGLNLVSVDPLHIKTMNLEQNPKSPVNIQLKFSNVDLAGIAYGKVTKVVGFERDPNKSLFEIHAHIPKLALIGPYAIKGRILLFPVLGSGQSNLTFVNSEVAIKFPSIFQIKHGKKYLNIPKIHFEFNPSRLWMTFENLFDGDKALSDSMNHFLNENWTEIFVEIKPAIVDAMASILQQVINGPFQNFPYDELFLE